MLPYELLLRELDIVNVRALEDLLIDCMYQGLIKGKLDQKYQCVEVYEAISRDIKEGDVDQMIKVLKKWYANRARVSFPHTDRFFFAAQGARRRKDTQEY